MLPGSNWNTFRDRPVVIAAHWDAVPKSPGYNDNGSGVAVMLEVASTLARARCFNNTHSVIFVALDQEETGCLGSLEFVRSYLRPRFLRDGRDFQGAFILDTVANWDGGIEGTQAVPKEWDRLAPEAAKNIRNRNNKVTI